MLEAYIDHNGGMKSRIVTTCLTFLMLGGCALGDPKPCLDVFNPDAFYSDKSAEDHIKRLIPIGSDMRCVRQVLSLPAMLESKSSQPDHHIFRERKWTSPEGAGLALNSRIVIIDLEEGRVAKVHVN